MEARINKALDLNKLFASQAQGKLLKKHVLFPMFFSIKYDGNYVVVQVVGNNKLFMTSGGLTYTHTDGGGDIFDGVQDGAYLAERIHGEGKLGDRDRCNLKGSKSAQTSTGHTYKVFDYISIDDYIRGYSEAPFLHRKKQLKNSGIPDKNIATQIIISDQAMLDKHMREIVNKGWEGLMGISPAHEWKDTKSRKVDLIKYKMRPTADLKCIDTTEGEGKYEGLIGSLVLQDSEGRVVRVGSGLNDSLRQRVPNSFIGNVIEIEYERLADTYIQPTFIRFRDDKLVEDID